MQEKGANALVKRESENVGANVKTETGDKDYPKIQLNIVAMLSQ